MSNIIKIESPANVFDCLPKDLKPFLPIMWEYDKKEVQDCKSVVISSTRTVCAAFESPDGICDILKSAGEHKFKLGKDSKLFGINTALPSNIDFFGKTTEFPVEIDGDTLNASFAFVFSLSMKVVDVKKFFNKLRTSIPFDFYSTSKGLLGKFRTETPLLSAMSTYVAKCVNEYSMGGAVSLPLDFVKMQNKFAKTENGNSVVRGVADVFLDFGIAVDSVTLVKINPIGDEYDHYVELNKERKGRKEHLERAKEDALLKEVEFDLESKKQDLQSRKIENESKRINNEIKLRGEGQDEEY